MDVRRYTPRQLGPSTQQQARQLWLPRLKARNWLTALVSTPNNEPIGYIWATLATRAAIEGSHGSGMEICQILLPRPPPDPSALTCGDANGTGQGINRRLEHDTHNQTSGGLSTLPCMAIPNSNEFQSSKLSYRAYLDLTFRKPNLELR
jgi:hypothetical protein